MNANDRKRVAEALDLLEKAHNIIEDLASAEQEKFDNMSEGLQASENGQRIEQSASTLDEARDLTQSAIDSLNELE